MVNEHYADPRQRQLFKNIIYVGALASLLGMGLEVFFTAIEKQFARKEKLIAPNKKALQLGFDYAEEHYKDVCGLTLEPMDAIGDRIMIDGNSATALGAIYGGATVAAWYPITPSTSVVDAFEKYCKQLRVDGETGKNKFAIVQAEDELAAMGMVLGASWMGARSFTATSGPGVSLMSEFLGLGYFAEIPAVLFDVQRVGPSTGMPTRTQQGDLTLAAYASHGDTKHPFLLPATPAECFTMASLSFDLADRLQTPVIVLSDLDLGMNDHLSEPLAWDDSQRYDRGKVLTAEELERLDTPWGRYNDVDGDGIGYRTLPGTHPERGMYFTRGSSHDEFARYTEDSAAYERSMQRLLRKWETAKKLVPAPEIVMRNNAVAGVIYFGTSTQSAREAVDRLAKEGTVLSEMRLRAFPFSEDVRTFIEAHDVVFVVEQNRDAQMRTLLVNELEMDPARFTKVLNYDGQPITATFIHQSISQHLQHLAQATTESAQ
jgi:2-oxoglutarate ferredoxin oxidoreductase subunit alpha